LVTQLSLHELRESLTTGRLDRLGELGKVIGLAVRISAAVQIRESPVDLTAELLQLDRIQLVALLFEEYDGNRSAWRSMTTGSRRAVSEN
jgi:hypothetical protein